MKKMKSSNACLLFLVLGYLTTVCSGVVIKNLTVPKTYVLDHNTAEPPKPLILDCDFEESPDDTGVVIKWLFNNFPIYQWIPGSHPITLQKFKPHLDPLYRASEDSREMYRAISILNPTWNMTGNYTCSLLSFTSSDKQSAQLIVIEPPKEFDLEVEGGDENENVLISCSVGGIYPKPRLTINVNGRRVPGEVTDNESTRPTHGLYEVNTKVSMNVTLIDLPAFINCVLEIPETDYVQERSQTFNEVTTTTTTTTAQTLTYKDGESDDTNEISRLEAVVGSHERRDDSNGGTATTLISTALLFLSTLFLRYMA